MLRTLVGKPPIKQPSPKPPPKATAPAKPVPPHPVWSQPEAAHSVAQLYESVLRRPGDPAEQERFIDHLTHGRISALELIDSFAAGAKSERANRRITDLSDVEFIRIAFERIFGFVPTARELVRHEHLLGAHTRGEVVGSIFEAWITTGVDSPACKLVHDPTFVNLMGTDDFVDAHAWVAEHPIPSEVEPVSRRTYPTLNVRHGEGIVASVITSLYGGADHIDKFLRNITAQTIFDQCEVIIIDAASPDGEFEVIRPYLERFPNLIYHRMPTRIGIYEAWNIGVGMARGRYLTNANVDDLRRPDSLERQAEILDTFGFVDVVYQDFFYTFDPDATFDQVAAGDLRSQSPIITAQNLSELNYPHNAPMWRATLHDEVGSFNESLMSAGDAEFWWRVLDANGVFYKINDPHVVYFVNPEGISTRPQTRGIVEWKQLRSARGRSMVSSWLMTDREDFEARLAKYHSGSSLSRDDTWNWRSHMIDQLLQDLSAASRTASTPAERG